ncbi:MAG: hypothetical protein IJV93_03235 [Lentisphaeria bacterium]|nr:hypothetical protein [Lentisphaeria bacterium]
MENIRGRGGNHLPIMQMQCILSGIYIDAFATPFNMVKTFLLRSVKEAFAAGDLHKLKGQRFL